MTRQSRTTSARSEQTRAPVCTHNQRNLPALPQIDWPHHTDGCQLRTANFFGEALHAALPETEEVIVATLAEKWLEQGQAQGQAQGLAQGQAALLIRQLQRRFGGPLAESYRQRVEMANLETLGLWEERLADGKSLKEIFDTPVPDD